MFTVPRILFDSWSSSDYSSLFASEDEMEDCSDTIVDALKVSSIITLTLKASH